MRKSLPLLAIALCCASACSDRSGTASIGNNAEAVADALERKANDLDAMAETTANDSTAAMLEGAADNLEDQADNLRDMAEDGATAR